jgi:hypothetical protein
MPNNGILAPAKNSGKSINIPYKEYAANIEAIPKRPATVHLAGIPTPFL